MPRPRVPEPTHAADEVLSRVHEVWREEEEQATVATVHEPQ